MRRKQQPANDELRLTMVSPVFRPNEPTIDRQFSFHCGANLDSTTWGAWRLTYWVRFIDQELFIASLEVNPGTTGSWPRDKVTRAMLAAIPIDGLLSEVKVWLLTNGAPFEQTQEATNAMADGASWLEWRVRRPDFIAKLPSARSNSRGRKYSRDDADLRRIAEESIGLGQQINRGWLQALARREGELADDGITVKQPLKDKIRDCRTRVGYLAPTTRGSQRPPLPGPALMALWKAERDVRYHEWSRRLLTMNTKGQQS